MKKIEAIVRPIKLGLLRDSLIAIGVEGMTITEVKGFGKQKGHKEIFRGSEYEVHFLPKLKIELYTTAEKVDKIISTIKEVAYTGDIGDGKVFVLDLEQAHKIRTGETGTDSI